MRMDHLLPELNYNEAMIRLNGHKALYLSLLKKFTALDMANQIFDCMDAGKPAEAAAAAHTLKGTAANLALPLLADAARLIESTLRKGLPVAGEPETLKNAVAAALIKINMLLENGEHHNE